MTKKENFVAIKNILNETGNTEFDAFLDHEVELLSKKKISTNSKAAKETAARAEKVYNALLEMDKPVTVSELVKLTSDEEVAQYNGQRVTALLKKLGDRVKREEIKGKAYYAVA